MQAVLFVLYRVDKLDAVFQAWEAIGIRDLVALESESIHCRRTQHIVARFPFGFQRWTNGVEECSMTLFGVLPDGLPLAVAVRAVEEVVGDLDQPEVGFLVSWELAYTKGLVGMPGRPPGEAP